MEMPAHESRCIAARPYGYTVAPERPQCFTVGTDVDQGSVRSGQGALRTRAGGARLKSNSVRPCGLGIAVSLPAMVRAARTRPCRSSCQNATSSCAASNGRFLTSGYAAVALSMICAAALGPADRECQHEIDSPTHTHTRGDRATWPG